LTSLLVQASSPGTNWLYASAIRQTLLDICAPRLPRGRWAGKGGRTRSCRTHCIKLCLWPADLIWLLKSNTALQIAHLSSPITLMTLWKHACHVISILHNICGSTECIFSMATPRFWATHICCAACRRHLKRHAILDVIAVDQSPEMVAALRQHLPGVNALEGTATDLPAEDNSLDALFVAQVKPQPPPSLTPFLCVIFCRSGGWALLTWFIGKHSESTASL